MQNLLFSMETSMFILGSTRGPLASMHALDVMWVSFYSIGAMLLSVLIVSAARKWVKNGILSVLIRFIAFGIFAIGSLLMVLVVFTWPS